jgi:AcrR family transcriptional regulator
MYKVVKVFIAGPDDSRAQQRSAGAQRTRANAGAQRTRANIVAAAHECLSSLGIRKTSVEQVARAAGVSRGTVYVHFKDKGALVSAVLLRDGEQLRDQLAGQLDKVSTLREQLAIGARFSIQPQQGELIDRLRAREPEALDRIALKDSFIWIEASARFWVPRLQDAQQRGELPVDVDIEAAAEWVARTLHTASTVPSPRIDPSRRSLAEMGQYVSDHLLLGLRAGSATREERS